MPDLIVPPGGFAGFNQMVPAQRASLFPGGSSGGLRRGRRRKARSSKRRASASGKKRTRKLKFGSPAWQKKHRVGAFAKGRRRKRK